MAEVPDKGSGLQYRVTLLQAIKSLDSLNDQIVQYIFGPEAAADDHHPGDDHDPPPFDLHLDPLRQGHGAEEAGGSEEGGGGRSGDGTDGESSVVQPDSQRRQQDNLKASVTLIRRLLLDAQGKFRRMVEENKQLAVRIDGSIQSASHEVHALRAELADTNKRLSQIGTSSTEDLAQQHTQQSDAAAHAQHSGSHHQPGQDNGCGGDGGGGGGGGGGMPGMMDAGFGGGVGAGKGGPRLEHGDSDCGGGLRPGVKETDIDFCFSGGGGGDDGGGGCSRTVTKEETNVQSSEDSRAGGEGGWSVDDGGGGGGGGHGGETSVPGGQGCRTPDDTPNHNSTTNGNHDNHHHIGSTADTSQHVHSNDKGQLLKAETSSPCQEVTSKGTGSGNSLHPSYGELKLELIQSRQELSRAKEALQAMKGDRKRLKAEKVDLLHQLKQLYVTLDDKEAELRDFIRNYEQRVQESDDSIKQLAVEKEESEREKWEIIKKARESAERSVVLRTQLDVREQIVADLQDQVAKLKEQLAQRRQDESRDSNNATPTPADDNGHEAECTRTATPPSTSTPAPAVTGTPSSDRLAVSSATSATPDSTCSESGSCHTPDGYLSKDDSFSGGTPQSTPSYSDRTSESLSSLMKWMAAGGVEGAEGGDQKHGKKKKKSFGSLSRMFGRGRSRRSIALPHNESLFEDGSGLKLCLLTPDNYQEKLVTVDAMSGLHMGQWRAGQVLAWLEITLGMPMYGRNCAHNVKSGKVLLGLSDCELGTALGITNHIHRRKLRMAIEEHRDPGQIRYPQAARLDVTWVAHKLLPDLGLPQYSAAFERNLADGRVLQSLGRRDLEKHFDVHRKFHQASILHAIELLRRMDFDREKLVERRAQCEDSDSDLMVWTSPRVVQWIRSIDLGEFADQLGESGVHGAMMVLEPSFTADTLATALAIPPSKSYIRRHLTTELDTLLRPARSYQTGLKILRHRPGMHESGIASYSPKSGITSNFRRAALDTPNNNSKQGDGGGKGHTFTRSYRGQTGEDGSKGRLSFRGSLGRAFGKKIRDDLKLAFDSDSPKWKISAPIPIQHTSLDNVVEIAGDSTPV